MNVPRSHSRRRYWWVVVALLPLALIFHGRVPDYQIPDVTSQLESSGTPDAADWSGVTRIGRLIARVPHARIVFPTALILAVWLLTIVIAYSRDIYFQNRNKKAESKLFNELVNNSRVGYCAAGEDDRIEACNVALADMLGLTREEVVGRFLRDVGLDPECLVPGDVTALTISPPGGPEMPVLAAAMEGDDEVGLQVIVAPFPGRSARGEDRAPLPSEQGDAAKREFLRSLNHELRTPLTVILGSATILESDVSEGNADLVDAIKEGGERLLHVLEAMMLLSELETENTDAVSGAVEMGAVLREAAAEYAGSAKEKGLGFHVDVPDQLVFAAADPRGVRQIVAQLIDNAIKFTDRGEIRLVVSPGRSHVRMSIIDTGRGIDPSVLAVAASDFREGPQSGRTTTGIGLGLARLIAERMKGRLEIESMPGEGTRVDVYLPDASFADDGHRADPLAA